MEKRRNCSSNFSSFPHYIYISNFCSQIAYPFVKCVVQFIVFLTLSTLICRGTDISKCFSESLGIRDNESRLYSSHLTPNLALWLKLPIPRTNFHGPKDVRALFVTYYVSNTLCILNHHLITIQAIPTIHIFLVVGAVTGQRSSLESLFAN